MVPPFPCPLWLAGVGGCLFPALSWHGAQSQAQGLTGDAQSHGGQDDTSLPPLRGTLLQPRSVGEWRTLPLPCASPWGRGGPYHFSELRTCLDSTSSWRTGSLHPAGLQVSG